MYREQLHAVPEGWRYTWTRPEFEDATAATKKVTLSSAGSARTMEAAEATALRILSTAGYLHTTRVRPAPGIALIHSAERLIRRSPVPYVLDLEHVDLFVIYQRAAYRAPWTVPLLERMLLDERLRFLLPWSNAARQSVLHRVSPSVAARLEHKLRTVYPAVRPRVKHARDHTTGPIRILFVGTKFYEKGAVEAIRAVLAARAAGANIELDIVTYAPPEWEQRIASEPGIRLHRPGGQDVVRALYEQADALLFPSHMDTYGVVVGEAMSYGVPVLAPNHLALAELVTDGVNGALFPAENMLFGTDTSCIYRHTLPPPRAYLEALRTPGASYVDGIAEALTSLADDPGRLSDLSDGALVTVTDGLLSVRRRATALQELYDAAAD
ncbi:MAG TPA: glycosyltransferase [Baekduia sp.]|nr:glycosyltransferase [Baekduia sp.]